ncbi:hypothetical protein K490DRAFT_62851 [Saccharata proteae CBS 121410]|uniref:Uncharacterized protein n=1 Tax=Saccharata proteae CBS 121410 TaxID=1314787 RepID=A0A9P4HYV7_9PEZI|nr:hypothetical protein K490DRAFT_62851 [Saccharata proteae CBS 121410]
MPPKLGVMSQEMWEPVRGFLPLEQDKDAKVEQLKVRLSEAYSAYDRGCVDDTNAPPDTDSPVKPRPCSAEFLEVLLKDLEDIADAESDVQVLSDRDETKAKIAKITTEGNRLVKHPELFVDEQTRQEFLAAYLGHSKRLRQIITEKRRLQEEKARTDQATHDASGFKDDLPRWTQFLGKDAPGADRLGLGPSLLQNPPASYQIIPEGGINILKQWDSAQKSVYDHFDQVNADRPGHQQPMWSRGLDWRFPGAYRTETGINVIDPMVAERSPWPKDTERMEQQTTGQAQKESLETLSEVAADILGHRSNGRNDGNFRFVVSRNFMDEGRHKKDGNPG